MSMEAYAGKHPVAHVGKTYHCMAHDIGVQLLDEAGEVTVGLLSRIGDPVDQPRAVSIETVEDVDPGRVADVVEACLADWGGVRDRLLAGSYELF
jgi:S-adenosylmethionine synthetase